METDKAPEKVGGGGLRSTVTAHCGELRGRQPVAQSDALAARSDLPGVAQASRIRDAEAVVGVSDTAHHPGAVGSVLAHNFVRSSAPGAKHKGRSGSGVVPQSPPDLLGCSGAGTQGLVGTCDFLRVAFSDRDGKSPTGLRGTTNRCGLLRGVNG